MVFKKGNLRLGMTTDGNRIGDKKIPPQYLKGYCFDG
jgi:hypothetical protein